MVDGRAPKGFNLCARTYSAPGLGVDGRLISAATCRMHRGTASPGEGQLPPCRRRGAAGRTRQPQFCLCQDSDPQQGSRVAAVWGWEQARKPGGARGARKQGPIPGWQEAVRSMSKAPSPWCLVLCCPITLHLGNKFKGNIRNGKIILKIIFFDNFKIILTMIKSKSSKTMPTER